jgi:hypothetical protein
VIHAPEALESRPRTARPAQWDFSRYYSGRSPVVRSKNLSLMLYARAFMWFHKIADFRVVEMHLLYKKPATKTTRIQHRQIIAALIEEGREIVRRIHASGGLIKPANGFSLQDVQAAIEELENTQLQWNGAMSKTRKAEILNHLFDAPE